jgi:succinate dehydrogenase / fumarate reductase membrane anchor subunit
MDRYRFRSSLGRAVGLGSAKAGFGHWWTERVTAVALVPLGVWFATSLIAHSGSGYEAFIGWLGSPVTASLMILLLIALFWHAALGLQVVIENYVHSGAKVGRCWRCALHASRGRHPGDAAHCRWRMGGHLSAKRRMGRNENRRIRKERMTC